MAPEQETMFEYLRAISGFGGKCYNEANDVVSSYPLSLDGDLKMEDERYLR